jgi:hypothetical protein
MISERTVGAALRGRPFVELTGRTMGVAALDRKTTIYNVRNEFHEGAATEGRPYSSFRICRKQ